MAGLNTAVSAVNAATTQANAATAAVGAKVAKVKASATKVLGQAQAVLAVSESAEDPLEAGAMPAGFPRDLSDPTKDPLGFVLQVGALLFGAEFLENKLNGLMNKLCGTVREPGELEAVLKKALYRMCVQGLGDMPVPALFQNPGYLLPVRLLDLFELFRLEPASEEGRVAQSAFEKAIVLNVLRRPGIAYRLPEMPYLSLSSDPQGQTVTVRFEPTGGPDPAPTRLVDLFAEIIYHPDFRLLDPSRIALDVLDVVLGATAAHRSARALEREGWLGQVVSTLSAETQSETLFDFSPPALAAVRARVGARQAGVPVAAGCDTETRAVPAASLVVPLVPGTEQPDLQLAYHQLLSQHLVASGSPGAGAEAPLRDQLSQGLAKALVLVLARNTVLAPRVWTLLLLSRLFRLGYRPTELVRYTAAGVNEADFKDIVTGVRPLLEEAVQVILKAGVKFLTAALLKKLRRALAPLVRRVAGEQAANYLALLDSLLPLGVETLISAF